jgi:ketosteroid isomerase-like protein
MQIERLTVQNYCGFEYFELRFDSRFNLLVGDNGSGKTSILDAVCIAAGSWLLGIDAPRRAPSITEGDRPLITNPIPASKDTMIDHATDPIIEVAQQFVAAINRQDVDALVALMTDDHLFTDSLGNTAKGRDSMRQGWKLYFQMVPDYRLNIEETYANGESVVMLGEAAGTYSHGFDDVQAMGLPHQMHDGSTKTRAEWKTPAAVRAKIKDGKVAEWRVFADNEPLRKLMRDGAAAAGSN